MEMTLLDTHTQYVIYNNVRSIALIEILHKDSKSNARNLYCGHFSFFRKKCSLIQSVFARSPADEDASVEVLGPFLDF